MAAPSEITLVPLGPLTNIARALQAEPRLASNLAGIVLMGGNAFCGGNASPAAEANIIGDPEAADIVFDAECPVVMAGLDVTERIVMTGAQLDLIGSVDNARARHLHAILPYYRRFALESSGLDGIHVHDSTTISYLLAPQHFTSVRYPIRVDTGDGVGRGKTWPRTRPAQHGNDPWAGRPLVTILTDADVDAVVRLELVRLGVTA
jgi:inosine-uridine nucleoside N-ribohydrolase